MAQTLTEKLRILADAAEAGEVMVYTSNKAISCSCSLDAAILYINTFDTISRIPKPKEQIQVGERWINAPLREMPKPSEKFWSVDSLGKAYGAYWRDAGHDHRLFDNGNCWAVEEDATAWHEASLALRKGGAA